MIFQ
jgi:hypothetical protein